MRNAIAYTPEARPILHLSGPKLRGALEALIAASEPIGGIERLAAAVQLKSRVLQSQLGDNGAATLERAGFDEIATLMPTVRRRVGRMIGQRGWPRMRDALVALLRDARVPGTADQRMAEFEASLAPVIVASSGDGLAEAALPVSIKSALPASIKSALPAPIKSALPARGGGQQQAPMAAVPHANPCSVEAAGTANASRFIRDLAAEVLHGVHPEHYPLMARWIWDAAANTGVLREIWHDAGGETAVDRMTIAVPDTYATFLVLREELSQLLSDNGIFRDVLWYVDLIQAHIYAGYINAQGGAYLKADFNASPDPLEHTYRILGLDRVASRRGPTVDGVVGLAASLDRPR